MLNSEKFKTANERTIAFDVYCRKICTSEDGYCNHAECAFSWLDREAEEEKPLPCPYCGGETRVELYMGMDRKSHYRVVCDNCYMQSSAGSREDVVETYNRVARAVISARENELKGSNEEQT